MQPLSLIGCLEALRASRAVGTLGQPLSLWRLLQGLARRANAGAASLQLEHHTRHLALCKWQRYGTGAEQQKLLPNANNTRTTNTDEAAVPNTAYRSVERATHASTLSVRAIEREAVRAMQLVLTA